MMFHCVEGRTRIPRVQRSSGVLDVRLSELVIALLIALIAGCSDEEFRSSIERDVGPLLVPGYTNFRIDRENVDVGVIVFSYSTPAETRPGEILTTVQNWLREKYPCYSALQQSADQMQIRCGNLSGRLSDAQEYRFAIDREGQRLFVLWIRQVPIQRDVYNEFVHTLDEVRNRR